MYILPEATKTVEIGGGDIPSCISLILSFFLQDEETLFVFHLHFIFLLVNCPAESEKHHLSYNSIARYIIFLAES